MGQAPHSPMVASHGWCGAETEYIHIYISYIFKDSHGWDCLPSCIYASHYGQLSLHPQCSESHLFCTSCCNSIGALGSNGIPLSCRLVLGKRADPALSLYPPACQVILHDLRIDGIHPAVRSTVTTPQSQALLFAKESMEPSLADPLLTQNPIRQCNRLCYGHYISAGLPIPN